ncbi:MAG: hypothetical protein IJD60_07215 [Clostridia bacterium]|nr:hypothetical protein [Clostridia bacterium]
MKRRSVMRLAEALFFLIVLCAVVALVSFVVERKESRMMFGGFLEEPEAYDVLLFGDSQCVTGVMPMEMYKDYGIAGYNLASYSNMMPLCYWTMINALDYASPKVVVFAVNGMFQDYKISRNSSDVHTAMDFWPLSVNKVRMINDLFDDPEHPDYDDVAGNRYRDLKWEYYFPLGKYHSRWSELTQADFAKRPSYARGGEFMTGVFPIFAYETVDEDDYAEEGGYSFAYLRAAIEECLGRGIDVVLAHMPAPMIINSQRFANTARSIADEYGIGFIDATLPDSIVDYAVDCMDEDPHLNNAGTLKMTAYLASYLDRHYDLPDRRQDPGYAHWQEHLQAYTDEKMSVMRSQESLENVLMLLHDTDYDFSLYIGADAPVWYDELLILLMHNIARERVLSGEEYDKSSNFMFPLEGFDAAIEEGGAYCLHRENGVWREERGAEAESAVARALGADAASTVAVDVYDRRTGETAAQKRF